MEALKEQNWALGGESSGHLICLDQSTTGDGIVAALKVLAAIADSNKTLHALKKGMDKYPQQMINVRIKDKVDPYSSAEVTQAVSDTEERLADKGRVLLRASGTEPLIRVMIEGSDAQQVMTEVKALAKVVETAFA
jgi:phosphoglucosamine mutase